MELLKDTRNFLTHYGDQRSFGKEFLWSRTIVALKEKARLFLEICLLGMIGMSDDEIVELLNQFLPYEDWCMETVIEIANDMLVPPKMPRVTELSSLATVLFQIECGPSTLNHRTRHLHRGRSFRVRHRFPAWPVGPGYRIG